MLSTVEQFFHRLDILPNRYQKLTNQLYSVTHNGISKLVYFVKLTVPPWTEWRTGGKQFQVSFFTAPIRNTIQT